MTPEKIPQTNNESAETEADILVENNSELPPNLPIAEEESKSELPVEIIKYLQSLPVEQLDMVKIKEDINRLNLEDYKDFCEKFGDIGSIRHELPQEFFNIFLERGFVLEKQLKEEEVKKHQDKHNILNTNIKYLDFGYILRSKIDSAVSCMNFIRKNAEDLSARDRAFLAIQKLYTSYPDEILDLWKRISQNLQAIEPKLLLTGIAEMNWRPDVSEEFKDRTLSGLNLLMPAFSKNDLLIKIMDFNNPDNFSLAGKYLELIKKLLLSHDIFSRQATAKVISMMEEELKNNTGNYLLNRRIRQILNEVQKSNNDNYRMREEIFEFSPGYLGFYNFDDRLSLATPDKQEAVTGKIKELSNTEKQFLSNFSESAIKRHDVHIDKRIDLSESDFFHLLSSDDLFVASSDNKEVEQEEVLDYEYLISPFMQKQILEDFAFDIYQLPIPAQRCFLNFLKKKKISEIEPAQKFIKQFGFDGAMTFLAMEKQGEGMAEQILTLGESLKPEDAKLIFSKYKDIALSALNLEQELPHILQNYQGIDQEAKNKIIIDLLKKADDLLLSFTAGDKQETTSIVTELEKISQEVLLFATTFKNLKDVTFDELSNVEITKQSATEISEEDKEIMIKYFKGNRATYDPDLFKETVAEFEKELNDSANTFYFLKHQGQAISFVRFKELANGNLYAGSFNVKPEVKQYRLGTALLATTLKEQTKNERIVEGVVKCDNPIAKRYVNEFNFTITGIDLDYHGTGQPFFILERDGESKEKMSETTELEKYQVFDLRLDDQSQMKTDLEALEVLMSTNNLVIGKINDQGKLRQLFLEPNIKLSKSESREAA